MVRGSMDLLEGFGPMEGTQNGEDGRPSHVINGRGRGRLDTRRGEAGVGVVFGPGADGLFCMLYQHSHLCFCVPPKPLFPCMALLSFRFPSVRVRSQGVLCSPGKRVSTTRGPRAGLVSADGGISVGDLEAAAAGAGKGSGEACRK